MLWLMPLVVVQPFHSGMVMKRFRFFLLDSMGRIDRGLERDCLNDAEALDFARQQTDAASVEVWQAQRLVARVQPRRAG